MTQKSIIFLIAILSFLLASAAEGASSRGSLVGGWRPIGNLKDSEVVNIAEFAVAQHNKDKKTNLDLVDVVKGETQVVSGTKYRLVVAAANGGGAARNYTAVVWSRPWQKFFELLSFEELSG